MRRYLPVIFSIVMIATMGSIVVYKKSQKSERNKNTVHSAIGTILKTGTCAKYGDFFSTYGIVPPIKVDLSQKHYKGIALIYGNRKVYHPKSWERFDYFETFTIDKYGNLYLIPMPFISITANTFEYLKNIYRVDSSSGKLSVFMHFEDVKPSPSNPFGLKSITYDCSDGTLWVSAIDESDYRTTKGVIYHIDPIKKTILSKLEGWDALSLAVIKTNKGKFLFFGSTKDNGLYAIALKGTETLAKPVKLFEIPNPLEHIRKIKVVDIDELELQTIPFSYTLITESSQKERHFYTVLYNEEDNEWYITKKEG